MLCPALLEQDYEGADFEMALFSIEEDMLFPEIAVMVKYRWHPISCLIPLSCLSVYISWVAGRTLFNEMFNILYPNFLPSPFPHTNIPLGRTLKHVQRLAILAPIQQPLHSILRRPFPSHNNITRTHDIYTFPLIVPMKGIISRLKTRIVL